MERKSASLFYNCPWENNGIPEAAVKDKFFDVLGDPTITEADIKNGGFVTEEEKNKPGDGAVSAMEQSREGQPKAYIPNFFYKPPFGYPRYKDLSYYRVLAGSVYVDMVETAIIDEVCSVEWDIVAEDKAGNEVPGKEKEIEKVQAFFENPNTNPGESWNTITRMMLPDLLEINSGILVKTFNAFGEMVEIVARNGSAFTKNPDVYGMFTHRADLILMKNIYDEGDKTYTPENGYPLLQGSLTQDEAREDGAYFQYGFNTGARPVPFGKREIIWLEKKVRTDDIYGRSAMEVLAKTVQTLIYAVEHNLEYFSDNSIPPGVLGLEGMNTDDLKAFGQQWVESQKKSDDIGQWKKAFHKLAIVNRMPKFERLGFTNQELQIIEQQKWWSTLVWGAFGMTATEMGFTQEAKGSANQIVQTDAAKRKIIYPLLRLMEYYWNTLIIPEFGFEGIRFKYKIFDVNEETKKWELYKLQTENDMKTINEIRNTEGLDSVEWGDKNSGERSPQLGTNINFNDPKEGDNKPSDKPLVKPKKKALDTDSPLILQPNEKLDDKALQRAMVAVLEDNKKKVLEVLESQIKDEPIMAIKSVDDIPNIVEKIFTTIAIKKLSDEVIKSEFDSGWESSEKKIDQNISFNPSALKFIQDYTFDNIKALNEEVANDLKAELQRGIINGEGITKLTTRVDKVFNKGKNRAEMIARTETNRADNQGKLLAMKGSGIPMKKRWLTHEDDRTSAICTRLDDQTIGINEDFKDSSGWTGQAPPSHVNCRSTILFIDPEELEAEEVSKKELLVKAQEELVEKNEDKEIQLRLQEKDLDIKERKSELLKKLESDVDEGN